MIGTATCSLSIGYSADQVKFTKDKYNPVDVYIIVKDQRAVGEIKVRDKKYEGYYIHLIETRKLKAILEKKKEHKCIYGFYFCFLGTPLCTSTILMTLLITAGLIVGRCHLLQP